MAKKKNMRNEFEFMSAVLDALGVQYKEADVKVRERWRSKVLDGWGVSYIPDDLKQFERWRKKCIEGLSKNSGGGGSQWINIYDNTVTTAENEYGANVGQIGMVIDGSPIKVTFDGVEYECNRRVGISDGTWYYGAEYADEAFDWSQYPFSIQSPEEGNNMILLTQTAGAHSVKIDIKSGGSSELTTANVTFTSTANSTINVTGAFIVDDLGTTSGVVHVGQSQTVTYPIVLYNGVARLASSNGIVSPTTGNVSYDETILGYRVTGDCHINLSEGLS